MVQSSQWWISKYGQIKSFYNKKYIPKDTNIILAKCVFKLKRDADGNITKRMVRLEDLIDKKVLIILKYFHHP